MLPYWLIIRKFTELFNSCKLDADPYTIILYDPDVSFCFRNSVRLAIRKIMYAPSKPGDQPSIEVSKDFMMSPRSESTNAMS